MRVDTLGMLVSGPLLAGAANKEEVRMRSGIRAFFIRGADEAASEHHGGLVRRVQKKFSGSVDQEVALGWFEEAVDRCSIFQAEASADADRGE